MQGTKREPYLRQVVGVLELLKPNHLKETPVYGSGHTS
jgi:hypothetical protein